jgi:hypothetical protein
MLVLADIAELFSVWPLTVEADAPVAVVKNKIQFEWASMMLFNNAQCRELTPTFIDYASNILFDFSWTGGAIASLPPVWNHCVGYDEPREDAKLVHFTQGIPFFPETSDTEYVREWRDELESMIHAEPWETLMGQSNHAPHVRARMARRKAS